MHPRGRDVWETINDNKAQDRNYSITPYSAFAHRLHQVVWPNKFYPEAIEKYDGTTNPKGQLLPDCPSRVYPNLVIESARVHSPILGPSVLAI